MFGNKTGRLMLEIETLREFGRKRILILKPDVDTRSGKYCTLASAVAI